MKPFQIAVRTPCAFETYIDHAMSSGEAAERAATRFADIPCGITVTSSEVH